MRKKKKKKTYERIFNMNPVHGKGKIVSMLKQWVIRMYGGMEVKLQAVLTSAVD
jgi:hypothetical protein